MEKEKGWLSAWQWRTTLKTLHVLLQKAKFYQNHTKVRYSITTNWLLLSSTCFGGLAAEKVLGTTGTFFTSLSSHWTRLNTSSSEISSSEYLDESVVPWYWKPKVSRACSGWILFFIQSNMTTSPVTFLCLRSAIRASSLSTWLLSTGFLFHSDHWIGGPGVMMGMLSHWFSI